MNEGTRKKTEKNFKETKITNLPDKEFKDMVMRMLTKPESRIGDLERTSTKSYYK